MFSTAYDITKYIWQQNNALIVIDITLNLQEVPHMAHAVSIWKQPVVL